MAAKKIRKVRGWKRKQCENRDDCQYWIVAYLVRYDQSIYVIMRGTRSRYHQQQYAAVYCSKWHCQIFCERCPFSEQVTLQEGQRQQQQDPRGHVAAPAAQPNRSTWYHQRLCDNSVLQSGRWRDDGVCFFRRCRSIFQNKRSRYTLQQ